MHFVRQTLRAAKVAPALFKAAGYTSAVRQMSIINRTSPALVKPVNYNLNPFNSAHTRADEDLLSIVKREVDGEKKNSAGRLPQVFKDFVVKTDKAEVILSKKFGDEVIEISMILNHSVDPVDENTNESALQCKPSFEVDVKKGNRTMAFTCSFMEPEDGEEQTDVFGINDVSMFVGEFDENIYVASGDLLDEDMYDKLLDYLAERGIDSGFVEEMSRFAGQHEHNLFLDFLDDMQTFLETN